MDSNNFSAVTGVLALSVVSFGLSSVLILYALSLTVRGKDMFIIKFKISIRVFVTEVE